MKHESTSGDQGVSLQRNVFFNLSVFQFLTFLRRGVFYTFMISYLFQLMGTVTFTAALGTLNMLASAAGQNLLWGKICDKYRATTKLIIAGETIAASAYMMVFVLHKLLIATADNFTAGLSIILGLSVLEFFWSMSDVGWAALLTDVTTPEIRGRVIGILHFIASLGRLGGITLAGFLYAEGEGFRGGTIFYVVTFLLLVGAGLMTFTSRRIKTGCTSLPKLGTPENNAKNKAFDSRNEKTYRWFLAVFAIIVLGAASINQTFLLFLQLPQGFNFSDPQMGSVLSAWTVGGMIASLAAGRLSDRFGRAKVLMSGLVLAIVTPLVYSFASTVPLMALAYGVNGVAFWIIQTVGFVLAGDLIPTDRRGRLLGRYNTVMALSWGPAGILIGGPLADIQIRILGLSPFVAYANAFYASSIIVALGTILFVAKVVKSKQQTVKS